jgi:FkbM family methyltransferase
MKPLLQRVLPEFLQEAAYYRHYSRRHSKWPELFRCARLAYCPHLSMFDLQPGDVISGNLAFNGFYERTLTRALVAKSTMGGGLLVDVGANMGYFSLLWAGSHAKARCIAFEASPRVAARMEANVQRNGLQERILVRQVAAGRNRGELAFDLGPADQTGWGGFAAPSGSTINVPVVRLDEELPNVSIDVLKVDVEGADTWVLYGCEGLLRSKKINTIYFEENAVRLSQLGIKPREAHEFLSACGYECIPLNAAGEWVSTPRRFTA